MRLVVRSLHAPLARSHAGITFRRGLKRARKTATSFAAEPSKVRQEAESRASQPMAEPEEPTPEE